MVQFLPLFFSPDLFLQCLHGLRVCRHANLPSADFGFLLQKFPELKFKYVEEEQPEEFFIPYVWSLVYNSAVALYWNPHDIQLFTMDSGWRRCPGQANTTLSYRKRNSAPRVNTWPLPACTLWPQSLRRMKLAASVQSNIDVLEADCHRHAGNRLWCEELMACRQPCIHSPIT